MNEAHRYDSSSMFLLSGKRLPTFDQLVGMDIRPVSLRVSGTIQNCLVRQDS